MFCKAYLCLKLYMAKHVSLKTFNNADIIWASDANIWQPLSKTNDL